MALVVLGGGAWLYVQRNRPHAPVAQPLIAVQAVSTEPARIVPVVESVNSYGNLVAARSVDIVPQSPGVVRKILFNDGQAVAAGTPLVVMDSSIAQAQLQSSQAQADTDLQNLHRTQSLAHQGLESASSVEQAVARAAASEAQVQINARRLSELTLRAPFAGKLDSSRIDEGAYVTPADTIVRLEDTSDLQVEFRIPSSVALRVTDGAPIHIQVPGVENARMVEGKLSFINPVISTDTRSVLLRAVEKNAGGVVWPGLYVRVSIDLRTNPAAIVVPVSALGNDLNAFYVFVVDDKNMARRRDVTIGMIGGGNVEIRSGLKEGEQVVTVGRFRLNDGDLVKVEPAAKPAEGASVSTPLEGER